MSRNIEPNNDQLREQLARLKKMQEHDFSPTNNDLELQGIDFQWKVEDDQKENSEEYFDSEEGREKRRQLRKKGADFFKNKLELPRRNESEDDGDENSGCEEALEPILREIRLCFDNVEQGHIDILGDHDFFTIQIKESSLDLKPCGKPIGVIIVADQLRPFIHDQTQFYPHLIPDCIRVNYSSCNNTISFYAGGQSSPFLEFPSYSNDKFMIAFDEAGTDCLVTFTAVAP